MSRKPDVRNDDLLIHDLTVLQDHRGFCFGIDAVLLAHFAHLTDGQSWVDLGCGCGVIALLLTSRAHVRVTGVEIQVASATLARASVKQNCLSDRIQIICADLRSMDGVVPRGCFDGIVCNPPYYSLNRGKVSPNAAKAVARHEICCTLTDVLAAADYLLTATGVLCLIQLACRYDEIVALLPRFHLYEQRRRFVLSRPAQQPQFVLLQVGRSPSAVTRLSALTIYNEQGGYNDEILAYYGQ